MTLGINYESTELGGGRIHHVQEMRRIAYPWQGGLRRITNLLGNTGDPSMPVGVSEALDFRIRDQLAGQSPLLFFGRGQSNVRVSFLNTSNVNGIVSGQSITFPNAWTNCDLHSVVGGHFVDNRVPLRTGHPGSFSLRFDGVQNFDLDTLSCAEFYLRQPRLISPNGRNDIPLTWVKSVQGGKTILTVNLPPGDWAGWILDPTIVLQPDDTDGVDALLIADAADTNYGGGPSTDYGIGERKAPSAGKIFRTLIKFNLGSLPANATITSRTLSTWLLSAGSALASAAGAGRLYRLKRAWVEAEATWNIWSTGNSWQTAGGFGANDADQTAVGSCAFATTDAADAQKDWLLTPTTKTALDLGNGWLMKADDELDDQYQIYGSGHATAANRPKLTVAYTLPVSGRYRFQGWRRA